MTFGAVVCLIFCFDAPSWWPTSLPAPEAPFCAVYKSQVVTKDDVLVAKGLPRSWKEKIAFNELAYVCLCQQKVDARCAGLHGGGKSG